MRTPLVTVLERASRGEATFTELAAVLVTHDDLFGIMSAESMAALLAEAKRPDARAGAVRLEGVTTADGRFAARVFTDDDAAAAYGRANGHADADGGVPITTLSAVNILRDCLTHGWAGLIVDEGTDHTVNLHPPSVKTLYALLTLDVLARLPQLHVVLHGGRPHLQSGEHGPIAFVYETAADVAAGQARQPASVTMAARDTGPLLDELLAAGVVRLVVNPGMPTERSYDRGQVERMIVAAGGGAGGETSGPVLRARLHALPPMVAPRGTAHADGRAALQALRASIESGRRPGWQLAEAIAFEHDLHVPVDPRPDDGLLWPQVIGGDEDSAVGVYTSPELATFMLSTNAPDCRRFEHVAGIEALRWIYAAPRRPRKIYVDLTLDAKDTQVVDAADALLVFFPLVINLPDLTAVARVGLGKLGGLPGARGLKPEVARALVQGARSLMTVAGPGGAPPAPVAHGAGHYLPAFSDADQFFAFTSRGSAGAKPIRSPSGSPFADWLSATVGVDGVLLDPAGPAPLPLSHADLLVLALWAEGKQPRGAELVATLATLQGMNELPSRLVGRIAAEWPAMFVLCRAGERRTILTPRDRTGGAMFTSREAAQRFLDAGGCAEPAGPVGFYPRWASSPFETMLLAFREAWIDPDPAGGGLHLDEAALLGAVEVLDERLQPRVPWLIA